MVGGSVMAATITRVHSTSIESCSVTASLDYITTPTFKLFSISWMDSFKDFCINKTYPTLFHHIGCT